jgi:hypothetical protein
MAPALSAAGRNHRPLVGLWSRADGRCLYASYKTNRWIAVMPFDCTGQWSPPPRVPSGRGAVLGFVIAWAVACCTAGALVLVIGG